MTTNDQSHLARFAVLAEDQARVALRDFDGGDVVETWIAGQAWQVAPDGWSVAGDLDGWRFQLRSVSGGLRVSAAAPGNWRPAVWVVRGARDAE